MPCHGTLGASCHTMTCPCPLCANATCHPLPSATSCTVPCATSHSVLPWPTVSSSQPMPLCATPHPMPCHVPPDAAIPCHPKGHAAVPHPKLHIAHPIPLHNTCHAALCHVPHGVLCPPVLFHAVPTPFPSILLLLTSLSFQVIANQFPNSFSFHCVLRPTPMRGQIPGSIRPQKAPRESQNELGVCLSPTDGHSDTPGQRHRPTGRGQDFISICCHRKIKGWSPLPVQNNICIHK